MKHRFHSAAAIVPAITLCAASTTGSGKNAPSANMLLESVLVQLSGFDRFEIDAVVTRRIPVEELRRIGFTLTPGMIQGNADPNASISTHKMAYTLRRDGPRWSLRTRFDDHAAIALHAMGYTNLSLFHGGWISWAEHKGFDPTSREQPAADQTGSLRNKIGLHQMTHPARIGSVSAHMVFSAPSINEDPPS